jgi:hypothetical protein
VITRTVKLNKSGVLDLGSCHFDVCMYGVSMEAFLTRDDRVGIIRCKTSDDGDINVGFSFPNICSLIP